MNLPLSRRPITGAGFAAQRCTVDVSGMTQVEPAEILRSANERSNGGKRRRRYPTSHNAPLNTSPCFSPSNLDASSPTDRASGNTPAPPRTPQDEPSASVPNDFFGSSADSCSAAEGAVIRSTHRPGEGRGRSLRPCALAVFRLMTRLYLVGACIGKSAGLSPLRTRSMIAYRPS